MKKRHTTHTYWSIQNAAHHMYMGCIGPYRAAAYQANILSAIGPYGKKRFTWATVTKVGTTRKPGITKVIMHICKKKDR